MKAKKQKRSRLTEALLETAQDMRRASVLDQAAFAKITLRHIAGAVVPRPLRPKEIRALREQARMSQAVFAHHLNVTTGYVSQLERGVKHPTGAALALLDVIRRKGMDAVL
jgi:putative transcriptional regulator